MQKHPKHLQAKQYIAKALKTNPFELWRLIQTAVKTFQFRYVKRCIKEKTIVGCATDIINFSNVTIGAHCLILDHVYLRAGQQGKITIDDYCAINSFAKLFGHGGITIGSHSQIGPNCLLTTTTHNYQKGLLTTFKKITIGKNVWVGAQSIILAGITVGDNSVIGAGSIVTKDIPPNTVTVGNPARVIKNID